MDYLMLLAGLLYTLGNSTLYDSPVTIQNVINTTDAQITLEVWEPNHSFGPTSSFTSMPHANQPWQKIFKFKKTKINIWLMKNGSYDRCLFSYTPSGKCNALHIIIKKENNTFSIDFLDASLNQNAQSEDAFLNQNTQNEPIIVL